MQQRVPINNQILQLGIQRVRVVDAEGKQIGVMDIKDALRLAQERGLDLIGITDRVDPPVCKIMDYGKYLYQEEKKRRQQKSRHGGETKIIRLSFNISAHDMEVRANQAEKFLKQGNRVLIEMPLRGREKTLKEFAKKKFSTFLGMLTEKQIPCKIEHELKSGPMGMTMTIAKQ